MGFFRKGFVVIVIVVIVVEVAVLEKCTIIAEAEV
jgi:hypothetical protein